MSRWKLSAAMSVAAVLALSGCGGGEDSSGSSDQQRADQLTLVSISSPVSYDLAKGAEWGNRSLFFEAVFDTLLRLDPEGEFQPGLASGWSYNDDKTVLKLTIRDGVTFSDGTEVDADAVVASLKHLQDGSAQASEPLSGLSIEASNDHEVTLTLPAPDPSLLNALATASGLVQAPSSFDSADVESQPVGSGPYTLDTQATVTGTTYVYRANPDYWDPEAVKYDNLTINTMADQNAIDNAISAGEANGAPVGNSFLDQAEAAGWSWKSAELDFQGIWMMDRDGQIAEQLSDIRVRKAINMAFDRPALLKALENGHGTVTEQIFATTGDAYDPELDSYYPFDPEKAKSLLAEAGYPEGFDITLPSISTFQNVLDMVQQQLADIGVRVTYEDPGQGQFLSSLLAKKYSMTWMSLAQSDDWTMANYLIAPSAQFNPFGTEDDKVDGYLDDMQSGTEKEAAKAVRDLNEYIVDQAWFAPLYRVEANFGVDANTEFEYGPGNVFPSLFAFSPQG